MKPSGERTKRLLTKFKSSCRQDRSLDSGIRAEPPPHPSLRCNRTYSCFWTPFSKAFKQPGLALSRLKYPILQSKDVRGVTPSPQLCQWVFLTTGKQRKRIFENRELQARKEILAFKDSGAAHPQQAPEGTLPEPRFGKSSRFTSTGKINTSILEKTSFPSILSTNTGIIFKVLILELLK